MTPATVRAAGQHDRLWERQRSMRNQNIKCSSLIKLNHCFMLCYYLIPAHHLPPPLCYHAFGGHPNHDDSVHVDAQTIIVTPQTSSPMCWWWDWPIVCNDSGVLRRYHAIYDRVLAILVRMSHVLMWKWQKLTMTPLFPTRVVIYQTHQKHMVQTIMHSNGSV
jgi:hypothetical protein